MLFKCGGKHVPGDGGLGFSADQMVNIGVPFPERYPSAMRWRIVLSTIIVATFFWLAI